MELIVQIQIFTLLILSMGTKKLLFKVDWNGSDFTKIIY